SKLKISGILSADVVVTISSGTTSCWLVRVDQLAKRVSPNVAPRACGGEVGVGLGEGVGAGVGTGVDSGPPPPLPPQDASKRLIATASAAGMFRMVPPL